MDKRNANGATNQPRFKVTIQGRELVAKLLDRGGALEIARVAVGQGKVAADADLATMTDLVDYVAEGTVSRKSHLENKLYITVQYSSNATEGLGAFYLSEFGVYAKDPDTGENVLYIYATLGDYTQPVPPYDATQEPDVRSYPVVTVLSDEISVTYSAPAGLITFDDVGAPGGVAGLTAKGVPPDGQRVIFDDNGTGDKFLLGIENGKLYMMEA